MSGHGKAKDLAILGAFQARMAYKTSKQWAEQGYDPGLAAQKGQTQSTAGFACFWFVFLPALIIVPFVWGPGLFLPWKLVTCALGWMLWKRYTAFKATPPDVRLRYRWPTGRLIAGYAGMMLIGFFLLIFYVGLKPALAEQCGSFRGCPTTNGSIAGLEVGDVVSAYDWGEYRITYIDTRNHLVDIRSTDPSHMRMAGVEAKNITEIRSKPTSKETR